MRSGLKGFLGTTLIDYPDTIASIVYISGCNFRCPFCYNKRLVLDEYQGEQPDIPLDQIYQSILQRKNFIDGVVITGGEALLWPDLHSFLTFLRKHSTLKVKLDTNGSLPERLESLLEQKLLDYLAMDIKGGFSKYGTVCENPGIAEKVKKCMALIRSSGLPYEWRTTVFPPLFDDVDILEILPFVQPGENYFFQKLAPIWQEMIDSESLETMAEYTREEIKAMTRPIQEKGVNVLFRGFD